MSRQYAITLLFADINVLTVGWTANTRRSAERRALTYVTQDCKARGLALPERALAVVPCSVAEHAELQKEYAAFLAAKPVKSEPAPSA